MNLNLLICISLLVLSNVCAETIHQLPLIPHRGEKTEQSKYSDLSAPYQVESHTRKTVVIDLGESKSAPKVITVCDANLGAVWGTLLKVEQRWEQPCPNHPEKISHYAAVYQARGIKRPIAALAGKHAVTAFSTQTNPTELTVQPQSNHVDLVWQGNKVLRSIDDYNTPSINVLAQFTYKTNTYYLAQVTLKIEDTVGLLFNNGESWEFLYRTVEPSGRRTICD